MLTIDNSRQCAFPTGAEGDPGLTKREYAAIQIAAASCVGEVIGDFETFARHAVTAADAVLAELAKS